MFPRDRLKPEPSVEHEQAAIEIEREGLPSRLGNRLPGFRPKGKIGGRNEPLSKTPLLIRRSLGRRREANEALDQPKQKRKIKVEPLGVGHAGEPLDIAMQPRAVDLGQRGESGGDLGVKLDALA